MNYEQTVMHIISNAGNARANALKAIKSARKRDFKQSDNLILEARESMVLAHKIQTELIQAETRGDATSITLLMVHAQDHLMNAMTVLDLAIEIIEDKKVVYFEQTLS